MDPLDLVIITFVSVTLLILYRLDLLPRAGGRAPEQSKAPPNPYPAVSIRCVDGCEAAQQLKGRRFLGEEAPELPLENCTAATCHCRYAHHVDRRTGILDRRRSKAEEAPSIDRDDQREGRGRRASDWIAAYQLNIPQH